ncbi:MAG: hypothetical protein IBX64_03600 [Actinobacteria bacterium]|nr:hypothetical protein [Actinomycetota bacterium]
MHAKISLEQVEQRLNEYSQETLRKIIMEWAKSTPSAGRRQFLARLLPPLPQQLVLPPDEELLEEIRELAKRVEDGDYCVG